MSRKKIEKWGDWIVARWRFLGYIRLADLATAVGCRVELISRWHGLDRPPEMVRKGFDESLVRALRSDRQTVFVFFDTIAPEDAPINDRDDFHHPGPHRPEPIAA